MALDQRAGPSTRPLVVICSGVPWRGTTMLEHHLARELGTQADVLFVDPPTSPLTRLRNPAAAAAADGPGTERVDASITVVRPRVLPLKERPIGKSVAMALTRRTMRRAVRTYGRAPDAVIVPSLNRLFGVLDERVKVYYATDDFIAGADLMGVRASALARRAAALPRLADVTVAISPVLTDSLRARGHDTVFLPNGVDAEHFAGTPTTPVAPDLASLDTGGAPLAGFVGILGDRMDLDLLDAVVDAGVHLLLVGPRQRGMHSTDALDALLARPEVHHVGPRPYADLPSVLAAADVWLLPYGDSDFNRASFPLKLLEYLAAGRRVVATDLPAVRWLDTTLVTVGSTPKDFAASVVAETARPADVDDVRARQALAAGHTWSERVRVLADLMQLTGAVAPREGRR